MFFKLGFGDAGDAFLRILDCRIVDNDIHLGQIL